MKNFSNTIGNRTRDIPACGAVPQRIASLRALTFTNEAIIFAYESSEILHPAWWRVFVSDRLFVSLRGG
jgi:hypothetical protein